MWHFLTRNVHVTRDALKISMHGCGKSLLVHIEGNGPSAPFSLQRDVTVAEETFIVFLG
jgi:hypothetical protein